MAVRTVEQLSQHYQDLKIFDERATEIQPSDFNPPKVRRRVFPPLETAQSTISKSNLVFTRLHLNHQKGPMSVATSSTAFGDN